MLVPREIELRMPDSGAREAAQQLRVKIRLTYDAYFRRARACMAGPIVVGGVTLQDSARSARSG